MDIDKEEKKMKLPESGNIITTKRSPGIMPVFRLGLSG